MRVFIAIELNDKIKDELVNNLYQLEEISINGSYSRRSNFHLTIAFLGEVDYSGIEKIKTIMDDLSFKKELMNMTKFGSFKTPEGETVFRKIEVSDSLIKYRDKLISKLIGEGFSPDTKPFNPHITLSRKTILKENAFLVKLFYKELTYEANHITLMKSERIDGVLTYTPIYRVYSQEN